MTWQVIVLKKFDFLCVMIVILTIISACTGVFYTTGGERFTVKNIYGENIELYGDGIYKYDTVSAAGTNKGTDFTMLFVATGFAFLTVKRKKTVKDRFLQAGLLSAFLYYASYLVFGVTFNRLFPVYVLLFSSSLFALIFLLSKLIKEDNLSAELAKKSLKGTAIFIIICGLSVFVWLPDILQALIAGPSFEIYITEPTFVLDFGVILPLFVGCGILILKKKILGYKLASIPLTLMPVIGLLVIGQTFFQKRVGIIIPVRAFIGLVVSFIILGLISIILNTKFMKYIKEKI